MKKILNFTILTIFVLSLTSCSDIDYPPVGIDPDALSAKTLDNNTAAEEPQVEDKYNLLKYDITPTPYGGISTITPPAVISENGDDSQPRSYTFSASFNASQHYSIGIEAYTFSDNSVVELSSDGVFIGVYYISNDVSTPEESQFFYLEPVYLPQGNVELTFTALRGKTEISRVAGRNADALPDSRFDVTRRLITPIPSVEANELFGYIGALYGERVLTAQYVTPNYNAEIEAVYKAVGRKPAVRFGDAGAVFGADSHEVALSEQWHKDGGIVGLTWTWNAPNTPDVQGSHFADQSDFSLGGALIGATNSGVEMLTLEQVQEMANSAQVSQGLVDIIRDIDIVSAALKELRDNNIPVLWNPLPDGGSRQYWWGTSGGESYVTLWRLMYDRMLSFHGLDNLIWVYSGGSLAYYPGDNRVDIIGESVFESPGVSAGSQAVKLGNAAGYGENASSKPTAVVSGNRLPSPNILYRDNAMWLMWAMRGGGFLLDASGEVIAELQESLDRFYNHELTVTLDQIQYLVDDF